MTQRPTGLRAYLDQREAELEMELVALTEELADLRCARNALDAPERTAVRVASKKQAQPVVSSSLSRPKASKKTNKEAGKQGGKETGKKKGGSKFASKKHPSSRAASSAMSLETSSALSPETSMTMWEVVEEETRAETAALERTSGRFASRVSQEENDATPYEEADIFGDFEASPADALSKEPARTYTDDREKGQHDFSYEDQSYEDQSEDRPEDAAVADSADRKEAPQKARDKTAPAHVEVSAYSLDEQPTIKEMVLDVLEQAPDGLSTKAMIEAMSDKFGVDVKRTSLSPQLSHMKKSGTLDRIKGQWSLAYYYTTGR